MADIPNKIQDTLQAWADAQTAQTGADEDMSRKLREAAAASLKKAFQKAKEYGQAGPLQTIKALSGKDDPFALFHQAEAIGGLGKDIAGHVAGQVNGMLQAASPVDLNKLPGMSGAFPPASAPGQGVAQFGRNIPIISDITNSAIDNFHAEMQKLGSDATVSQKVWHAGLPAAGKTIGQLTQPFKNLLTGRDADGNPLDAGSAARSMAEAGMLLDAGVGMTGGLASRMLNMEKLEGVTPKFVSKAPTSGEIAAAEQVRTLQKSEAGRQLALRAQKIRQAHQDGAAPTIAGAPETPVTADSDLMAGSSAVPLDERGHAVIADLAPKVQNLDRIYHSPTVRGHQTAEGLTRATAIPTIEMDGLDAPHIGMLEGQPTSVAGPIFDRMAQEEPDTVIPGRGPLSTADGESFNNWTRDTIAGAQAIRDEYTARTLQGEEPRIGAVMHSKNLELMQAWHDATPGGTGPDFDLQSYLDHNSGPPGAMYHSAPDADGTWKMTRAEDTTQPGIYLIRHGETYFDGASEGEEGMRQHVGRVPRVVPYEDYDSAREALPDVFKAQLSAEGILPLDVFKEASNSVIQEPLARRATLDYMRQGDPIQLAMAKVLQGPMGADMVRDLMDARGANIDDIQKAFTGAYEETSSAAGGVLGHQGNAVQHWLDQLDYTAEHGTSEEAASALLERKDLVEALGKKVDNTTTTLKNLRQANEIASGRLANGQALGGWSKVANIWSRAERLRIASMISPIRTASHIAASQFGLLGTDFMDAAFTALTNGFAKPRPGMADGPAMSSTAASGDLIGLTQGVLNTLPSKLWDVLPGAPDVLKKLGLNEAGASTVDTLLASVPTIKRQLGEGLLFDTNEHMFGRSMMLLQKASQEAGGMKGLLSEPSGYINKIGGTLENIAKIEDISAKRPGLALYNITNGLLDFKLYPNRWQEAFFRKLAFDARYRGNLANIGMSYDDALTELNRKAITETVDYSKGQDASGLKQYDVVPIRPELREALADAMVHSLRQTYAYTPEGGLFGSALAASRKLSQTVVPTSVIPGITFPRAMVNNLMWQIHHSPVNLAELFSSDFRDTLSGLKDQMDPTASRNASRKIGEAMTGLMIWNAALHMSNGGSLGYTGADGKSIDIKNGPKPWLWQMGNEKDEKGNPKYLDISSLQPFNNIWTMADHIMGWANGRGSTVTPMEAAGQLMNTNAQDAPLLHFDETLRNLGSQNQDTIIRALTQDLGQYLGGFTTVLKGMREEFAAIPPHFRSVAMAAPNSWLNLDTKTGFVRHYQSQALPDAMLAPIGSPGTLPKVDIATGQVDAEQHPVANLTGMERKPMTGFQQLLESTPGFDINQIVKRYDDPHATQLVRQAYGLMLNRPDFKGGDQQFQQFARSLAELHNPKLSGLLLKEMLPGMHQAAEAQAMLWDMAQDAADRKVPVSQGRPVHFAKELADKINVLGSDEVKSLVENFVKRGPIALQRPEQALQPTR